MWVSPISLSWPSIKFGGWPGGFYQSAPFRCSKMFEGKERMKFLFCDGASLRKYGKMKTEEKNDVW